MSIPLSFLRAHPVVNTTSVSLGEDIAQRIVDSSQVMTLLDCLCTRPTPAIYSPDALRPPLSHHVLRDFVSRFALPCSGGSRLGPNDRVMLVLEAGPEAALALLAIANYHTCAPVNANCTASELSNDAQRLGAKAIVTTHAVDERLNLSALRDDLGCQIIYVEPRTSGSAGLFDMKLTGGNNIASSPSKPHRLADTSLVLHTSGTSGKKKVVRYSLRSLLVGTWSVVESWGLEPIDVNLNMMPLHHIGGIVRNLLAPILSGGSAIMCSECDPIAFWNIAANMRATWYYAAPTIHQAVIAAKPRTEDLHGGIHIRMVCNAAGALLPSLATELKNTFNGAIVLPSYGMTECMPIACPPLDYKLDRPGSSGIAYGPHLSIRNLVDLEQEMPHDKAGAICVRGAPTFEGYEVSPDMNIPLDKSAFTSKGWFDSGDVGFIDADGYLFITGRSKEIINKGGEVISPFEIEEAIVVAAKDYVQSVLAFSIDHDVLQETIGVVLVPTLNRPRLSLPQLQKLLRNHLHPSKWPFAIVYMDNLPKNSAGKPLRIKLASRFGIGSLSDKVPILHRHFEAEAPNASASLAEPIPCRLVTVDKEEVERVLSFISGIKEFVLRLNPSGIPEALVFVDEESVSNSDHIEQAIAPHLPGYCLPELHRLPRPFSGRTEEFDFDSLKKEIAAQHSSALSEQKQLVFEIVADLLHVDSANISGDSDFFILGGNSLLLGQLSYNIRKQTGVNIAIPALFRNCTIQGIASLIDEAMARTPSTVHSLSLKSPSPLPSEATLQDLGGFQSVTMRNQTNLLCMIIQAIPFLFFYPMTAAFGWTLMLFVLSYLAPLVDHNRLVRVAGLALAVLAARVGRETVCPLAAILFKWIVIGRYKVGTYQMWSTYHLRWWIVDKSLRFAGKGIFQLHPSLQLLYYKMLGAHIGNNVLISDRAELGEVDLLTLGDGCRIDHSTIRGFCVERDGLFRLDRVTIGREAVINTYTNIAPGAIIPDAAIYGPHASSHDDPSPPSFAAFSQLSIRRPHRLLQVFVAWPVISFVYVVARLPWAAVIFLMFSEAFLTIPEKMDELEAVIWWFSTPKRVAYHVLAKIVWATVTPLFHIFLAILVKRVLGLNTECRSEDTTQLQLLRRHINSILLSQPVQKQAFMLLGSHYEAVSMIFRAMGAKVGKRIYWPGSGIYCLDPEMLEIGDDVVFGSRSEFFTTDDIGTAKIVIGDGAMVADRVVALPGTRIGRRTVMGSGALCKRDATYGDGETWIGNEHGEAICLSKKPMVKCDASDSTTTPFGKAFYLGKADYFVFPYCIILIIAFTSTALSAAFWSINAISAAQLLRQFYIYAPYLHLFRSWWYRPALLYGLIASFFFVISVLQAITSIVWIIASKWAIIGQRREGRFEWDKSDYCQRWQLHLTLSQFVNGVGGSQGLLSTLTGSTYFVWYLRAMGAKIGKNCGIFAGGKVGLMTEPDLVELGDNVNIDNCSMVAHINSRGNFALNRLKMGSGCAMRAGSRLLSGASMEDSSMLYEHSLLTSGEVADAGVSYSGWPAKEVASVG